LKGISAYRYVTLAFAAAGMLAALAGLILETQLLNDGAPSRAA
jgi:ribose/xylose/arabinose/galactoside ABC-type transport system permease subunit